MKPCLLTIIDGVYQSDRNKLIDWPVGVDLVERDQALSIMIAKDVKLKTPIHIQYRTNTASKKLDFTSHIILFENAEAQILEEFRGEGGSDYESNIKTIIFTHDGARLSYYKLQNEGLDAKHKAHLNVDLEKNSTVSTYHISLGAKESLDTLIYKLNGSGAHCDSIGLYQPRASQKIQKESRIEHRVSYTSSNQYYKGAMDDKGQGVFHARILVDKDTKQTVAHQANHNLLLSPLAQIDIKPELEIYADDVQCSHGATVGQLDESAMFYLRCRGIAEEDAKQILTDAFVNEIIERLPVGYIADHIERCVRER